MKQLSSFLKKRKLDGSAKRQKIVAESFGMISAYIPGIMRNPQDNQKLFGF